jgi:tetratricopeptide (TPR) repeat protein
MAAPLPAQMTAQRLVGQDISQIGPEEVEISEAIHRFSRQDFNAAHELFQAAVAKNAQLPPAHVLMARMYLAANNMAAARTAMEKASVDKPDDPEAFIALGEIAYGQNQLVEAQPLFAKGLKLSDTYTKNPRRQKLLRVRGLAGAAAVQERQGEWAGAEENLNKWIEIAPDSALAHTRLGRALFEQEKYREAYDTFTRLYEKDDNVPRPEINMALLYEQASQQPGKAELHENARKLMDLAVERMPKHLETRLAAAQWGLEAGLLDFAKANARAALDIDPDSLPAIIAQGVIARHEKDLPRAEELFATAHLKSPANFAATNHLALTLIQKPETAQRRRALEFAQINARIYADLRQATGREAAVTLAWILYNVGREAEAMQYLSAAGRAGTITPESTYYAAKILVGRGSQESARNLLDKLLEQRRAFLHRAEAEQLLEKIGRPAGVEPGSK